MPAVAIRTSGLSKKYAIGGMLGAPHERLTEVLWTAIKSVGGRRSKEQFIWALRHIDIEISEGEAVGIIGRNGAGKTTLLKILSRITEPTEGTAELRGRVGSLLEVGTGFHPELTGRENVFLNGAILGMKRKEIVRKFDEIVDFAEIERFLDTPVKRYSSGMYVRLAFSVAAHLEPEILVVDEVLAVGDTAFQKKCMGIMENVAGQGRTVLFVSHNMPAVARLCTRAIWLAESKVREDGSSDAVIQKYLSEYSEHVSRVEIPEDPNRAMRLRKVEVRDSRGQPSGRLEMGEPFTIEVEYDVNRLVKGSHVICFVYTSDGVNVVGSGDADCDPERLEVRAQGKYKASFEIPAFLLGEGTYSLTFSLSVPFLETYDRHESVIGFEIFDTTSTRRQWQHSRRPGILGLELPWEVVKLD